MVNHVLSFRTETDAWMDNEGNRFTFSSQYDCDVYEEDGTSFYWHGEAADVYYMPVQ